MERNELEKRVQWLETSLRYAYDYTSSLIAELKAAKNDSAAAQKKATIAENKCTELECKVLDLNLEKLEVINASLSKSWIVKSS